MWSNTATGFAYLLRFRNVGKTESGNLTINHGMKLVLLRFNVQCFVLHFLPASIVASLLAWLFMRMNVIYLCFHWSQLPNLISSLCIVMLF